MNVSALSLDAARRSLEAWIRKLSAASASPASAESRVEDCRHDRGGNLERGWNASAPRAIAEPRRRRAMNAGVNILFSRLLFYLSTHGPCRPCTCSPASSPHFSPLLALTIFCLVYAPPYAKGRLQPCIIHAGWAALPHWARTALGDCGWIASITHAATGPQPPRLGLSGPSGDRCGAQRSLSTRVLEVSLGTLLSGHWHWALALVGGSADSRKTGGPLALSPLGSSIR